MTQNVPFSDPELIRTARARRAREAQETAVMAHARRIVLGWLSVPVVHLAWAHARARAPYDPGHHKEALYDVYRAMFDEWVEAGIPMPEWQFGDEPPEMLVQSSLNKISFL